MRNEKDIFDRKPEQGKNQDCRLLPFRPRREVFFFSAREKETMDRFRSMRRVQIHSPPDLEVDDLSSPQGEAVEVEEEEEGSGGRKRVVAGVANVTEDLEPFMGVKVRRRASLHRDRIGDYLGVPSRPPLLTILSKQGDCSVLFADKVLRFTGTGKTKRRILLITDFAIYLIDPENYALKRRIALAAVEKLCLSELNDNFFAIIIPTEYDCLMASTRKTEIVTVLVEATKSSDGLLEVAFSNRFDYNAAADVVKEIHFEEAEGGVKTRILRKEAKRRL